MKPSVVSNFVTILFKRILKDEPPLYEHVLNRLVAALHAINRLYPSSYNEVVDGKFSSMLSNANDSIFKRLFPLLCKMHQMWSSVDGSEKVRIEGLIMSSTSDDIIKYQIVQLSEINREVFKILSARLLDLPKKDKIKVYSSYPSIIFKDDMINIFVNVESFASAQKKSKDMILPISNRLDSTDVDKIFSGVLDNNFHGYNQILDSSVIDSFFTEFFENTKNNCDNHREKWCGFWEKLLELDHDYANLKTKMLECDYIEPEVEDELPF